MSIRLNLHTALLGADIPAEDIRPTPGRLLGASAVGRLSALIGNEFLQAMGAPERIGHIPYLEDRRSYEIFRRAKANFDQARPTIITILRGTAALRKSTIDLNKAIEFQNSSFVKRGRYALDAITVCAAGCGIGLFQTAPPLSAEGGTIVAGTIAGVALPQAIKYHFLPDLTASIQTQRTDIETRRQRLNLLWVRLEQDVRIDLATEDLLQAGYNLQRQLAENSSTYTHLNSRFMVPNPDNAPAAPAPQNPARDPVLGIQDAPAEIAQ